MDQETLFDIFPFVRRTKQDALEGCFETKKTLCDSGKSLFPVRFAYPFLALLLFHGCTQPRFTKKGNSDSDYTSSDPTADGADAAFGQREDVDDLIPLDAEETGGEGGHSDASTSITLVADLNCSEEGALRCVANGSAARKICHQGRWKDAEDCEADQICDTSNVEAPGTCVDATEICLGSAGEFICVDGTMIECNSDAIATAKQMCETQLHCQTGLPHERCAVCIPGQDYRCRGNTLERCTDDGSGYISIQECNDAQPCNAAAGACTKHNCLAGSAKCTSNQLFVCNDEQSAFELVQSCEAGVCDAPNSQCDICVAGIDRICAEDGKPAVCDAAGQSWDVGDCSAANPICVGQGRCVECATEDDCASSSDCRRSICSQNHCTSQVDSERIGTACGSSGTGVCNGSGECVACLDNDDCSEPMPVCSSGNQCIQCELAIDCPNGVCKVNTLDNTQNRCVECNTREDCTHPSDPLSWQCKDNRCVYRSYCGNGVLDKDDGEQCDDGSPTQPTNWASWDGCGTHCQLNTTWGCTVEDVDNLMVDFATQWVWTIPYDGVTTADIGDLATCAVPCAKPEWGWDIGQGNSFMYDTCPTDGEIPGTDGYNPANPSAKAVAGCINGACVIKCGGGLGRICPAGYSCRNPRITDMDVFFRTGKKVTTTEFSFCMADGLFEE